MTTTTTTTAPACACGATAIFIADDGTAYCGRHWIEQDDKEQELVA